MQARMVVARISILGGIALPSEFTLKESTDVAFPVPLASKMSGASVSQLAYWRRTGVLTPEIEFTVAPFLYSFRDIVALRTLAWLRGDHSLQMIRQSLETLREMDMIDHPSHYKLMKLGGSIGVHLDDGQSVDVAQQPGQGTVGTLHDVFGEFETVNNRRVDDLRHPRAGVEVNPARLGGWPTITGTRIPFDTIASLVSDGTIAPEEVCRYYPAVSASAARDALDYQTSIIEPVA